MPDLGGTAPGIQCADHVQVSGVPPARIEGEQIGGAHAVEFGEDRVLNETRVSEKGEVWQPYVGSSREEISLRVGCWNESHGAPFGTPAVITDGNETHPVQASANEYHHSITVDEAESVIVKTGRSKFREAIHWEIFSAESVSFADVGAQEPCRIRSEERRVGKECRS